MSEGAPRLGGVLETCLYHSSGEREAMHAFYGEVLGLDPGPSWPDGAAFRLGDGVLLLFDRDLLARSDGPLKDHGTTGPGHACLLAEPGAYESWKERIEGAGIEITLEQGWPGGGRSFYFKDPAGNLLEVADRDLWAG